jgi:RHS repeat-associated protein
VRRLKRLRIAQGAFASPYAFTGEPLDANGLVHLRARYYDPGMGRFLNIDPSWQEQNLFEYSANNPVSLRDPSGKRRMPTQAEWLAAGGWAERYSKRVMRFIWQHRGDIISAAKRHDLIPNDLSNAAWYEVQPLYTLAGILYNETWGYYHVEPYLVFGAPGNPTPDITDDKVILSVPGLEYLMAAHVPLPYWAQGHLGRRFIITCGALGNADQLLGRNKPSLGHAQVRPGTVQELEQEDLLCFPGYRSSLDQCISADVLVDR